jgi:hypothetical protein
VAKKTGTKTIHVNHLLRISMYSVRFGAASLDASQGSERRMAQLAAGITTAAVIRRANALPRTTDRAELRQRRPCPSPGRSSIRGDEVFRRRNTNCLEMARGAFHYSATDPQVAPATAAGGTDRRHPWTTEVPALMSHWSFAAIANIVHDSLLYPALTRDDPYPVP